MGKPIVGVSCCLKTIDGHPTHTVGHKYLSALTEAADVMPVLLPALGTGADLLPLLHRLDGILLTGSPSMVDPALYQASCPPETLLDPARDAVTLPLARLAVDLGLPLLAICRGHQELNVAFGGSLHQAVHELPGRLDHRTRDLPYAQKYAYDAHAVTFPPDSLLRRLTGCEEAMVNSLHWQAIDRLGDGLAVEAMAPDGTIEAVRVAQARGFTLSLQWHPEYEATAHPVSRAIFAAFGNAARSHALRQPVQIGA